MEVSAMAEFIDRKKIKSEAKTLVRDAQVSPKAFFALYLGIMLALDIASAVAVGDSSVTTIFSNPLGLFTMILTDLVVLILGVGAYLYCFGIRRGERVEVLSLFDGFSFVGKIIELYAVEYLFVTLWTFAFIVPGFIALYRYRFAVLNLCEDPSMSVFDAINMSKRQTFGYKSQLFALDLSYIGWMLLANSGTLYFQIAYQLSAYNVYTLPGLNLAGWISVAIQDVIVLAVGIFYLPSFHFSELGYFETAKRTSGTGVGIVPRDPGPDNI